MSHKKFTKSTLNLILETIVDEYFADDMQLGLWEVIEYVKDVYEYEISALEEW